MDHAALTDRLADLVVGVGANVQPGQVVGVTAYPGMEPVARSVVRAAYERGARWVDLFTFDLWVKRARLELAPEDSLSFVPPWMIERTDWIADQSGARIALQGPSQPRALEGVEPSRAGRDLLPYLPNTMRIVNDRSTNWCVAPAPSPGWARLVYPDLEPDAALDRLWVDVAHVCRLDEDDPTAAWGRRRDELRAITARLDEAHFDALRFHGPGTDLTIGLLPSSRWLGGGGRRRDGLEHFSNLPTEEVFTTPDPERADGVVAATRPLQRYGSFVRDLAVEFRQGRAVRIDASSGAEVLRAAAARDDGSSRLGEVALVDGSGRIGPLGTVFFETLLDENAASHIALGSGYLSGVSDPADGRTVPVLREGRWQL